jgi:hypothetical protein
VQYDKARSGMSDRVQYHEKLLFYRDADYSGAVYVLSLDGNPYGIYVCADGDNEADSSFFVTDRVIHNEAVASVSRWIRSPMIDRSISMDFELDASKLLGDNARFASKDGSYRLVDSRLVEDGTMLFDRERFSEAFDEFVATVLKADPNAPDKPDATRNWLPEAAQAILKGIPENLRSIYANEMVSQDRQRPMSWIAAAMATEKGTYLIGLDSNSLDRASLRWSDDIRVVRLGGPEHWETMKEHYGSRPEYFARPW